MEDKKAVIYGVRSGETYHYIGKTVQVNMDGNVTNSKVVRQYSNPEIREVFENNVVEIDKLGTCGEDEWYDEKLQEVVSKHGEQHPLLNADWMLQGKRGIWQDTGGWWQGKTRDAHTIQRLSESKFKKVLQYDADGNLIKIWEGGKQAAEQIFGDYRVVKFSGKTELYKALKSHTLKGRFRRGYYWFRYQYVQDVFGMIPEVINLDFLHEKELARRKASYGNRAHNQTHNMRYEVLQYNQSGEVIRKFDNTSHAAFELKITLADVQKFCRGTRENSNYILKYGKKTLQELGLDYGSYEVNYIKKPKKPKVVMMSRTYTPVLHYKNDKLLRVYEEGVREAVKVLGFSEYKIRKLCKTRETVYGRRLEFGEKKTVLTPRS